MRLTVASRTKVPARAQNCRRVHGILWPRTETHLGSRGTGRASFRNVVATEFQVGRPQVAPILFGEDVDGRNA
jgi:hypothetical protein